MNTEMLPTEPSTLLPEKVDEVIDATVQQKAKRPKNRTAGLIYEADIVLNTRIARYYFYRGGTPDGTGVVYFTKLIRAIWHAAANDDPFADLFLLRIYDALVTIRRDIQQKVSHYQQLINNQTKLKWKLAACEEPIQVHLYFKLTYGYMAANVIAEFDYYVNLIVSAKRLGILLEAPVNELINNIGEKLRHALELPKQWTETQVTREDMRQQNELAQKAQTLMGSLDPQILAGTLRAPDAPHNKKIKPE